MAPDLRRLARRARDGAVALATRHRRTVAVDGITLSLEGLSPRMRSVLLRGAYERPEADLVGRLLTPADGVIEAGSAIGFLALYCLKHVGVRDYHMVEANPDLPAVVARNFALNGLAPPGLTRAAVAAADGRLTFGIAPSFWASSALNPERKRRQVEVPARTLPSILAGLPFRPTTLIMDIEGTEAELPPGHFAPFAKIVLETHPRVVGEAATDAMLAALRAQGFREAGRVEDSVALTRAA